MASAKPVVLLALGIVLSTLGGCSGGTPPLATDIGRQGVYRLAPGDHLDIKVFGEDTLSKKYEVDFSGAIAFPLLGSVPAAGKTASELGEEIRLALSKGYLNDPQVTVDVVDYRPFYVLGEVTRSGEFDYKPGLTVTQAIAMAGGFDYRAEKKRVYIRHSGVDQEMAYDLTPETPVYVMPGDTIRVGERFF